MPPHTCLSPCCAAVLLLYAVEMKRNDSRHPHPTTFITTGSPETLAPETVADMYLSRWPNQEMVFRNLRNGAGLEHSHGYGGGEVTHGTLIPKIEDATKAESKCRKSLEDATSRLCTLKSMEKKADPDSKIEIHEVVKQAAKEVKSADKAVKKAEERRKNLETTPKTIFKRDTTRENIVTACTLSLMMLLEWVLREYFDGQRMEMRTFIEYFTFMPTEIRTSAYRISNSSPPPRKGVSLRSRSASPVYEVPPEEWPLSAEKWQQVPASIRSYLLERKAYMESLEAQLAAFEQQAAQAECNPQQPVHSGRRRTSRRKRRWRG